MENSEATPIAIGKKTLLCRARWSWSFKAVVRSEHTKVAFIKPFTAQRETAAVKEMAGYGCGTLMHIVRLNGPRLDLRDIDFSSTGIHARWEAGYADTMRVLERRPWEAPIDPMMGVAVHDLRAADMQEP
jgi:Patatin phospholipase